MNQAEADQIIDFLYGMHRPPDQDATRRAWRMQLSRLDADIASQACIKGMQAWGRFPSWPDFYTQYKLLSQRSDIPQGGCPTCGGDRLVVYATRPEGSGSVEEMAPCPDCNPNANTKFHRASGQEFESPDPTRVRRMMSS